MFGWLTVQSYITLAAQIWNISWLTVQLCLSNDKFMQHKLAGSSPVCCQFNFANKIKRNLNKYSSWYMINIMQQQLGNVICMIDGKCVIPAVQGDIVPGRYGILATTFCTS